MRIPFAAALAAAVGVCFILDAADTKNRPIVLKAARLFDGKSDRLTTPGYVLVRGSSIEAVGASVKITEDAEMVLKAHAGDAHILDSRGGRETEVYPGIQAVRL